MLMNEASLFFGYSSRMCFKRIYETFSCDYMRYLPICESSVLNNTVEYCVLSYIFDDEINYKLIKFNVFKVDSSVE